VDPRRPVRGSDEFYRYTGSFTTPPCTEGVVWAVATRVRRVSRHQVELLREAVHDVCATSILHHLSLAILLHV
jgi:carbonic anhydrase